MSRLLDISEEKSSLGKFGTARNYLRVYSSFKSFLDSAPSKAEEPFCQSAVCAYSSFLDKRDCTPNTVSFYMRTLRAVWNRISEETEPNPGEVSFPFRNVYTGVAKTINRSVPREVLRALKKADFNETGIPSMVGKTFCRDLFLFSLYCRGMPFVDMAFLKFSDVYGEYISYRRKKTGQMLFIMKEPCIRDIVDRWHIEGSEYALPILFTSIENEKGFTTGSWDLYRRYEIALREYNRTLKKIGERIGIPELSSYCARHSWACLAKDSGVPLGVISEGLGHSSEKTTRIYISSFERSVLDNSNKAIIARLGAK